jgi:CRP-like cAMP-binding protein
VPGLTLTYLADLSEELRMKKDESLVLDERSNNYFYVLNTGVVHLFQRGEFTSEFKPGEFIGEMLGAHHFINTNLMVAKTDVVILKFNKDQFYELLSDNVALADKVLEYI